MCGICGYWNAGGLRDAGELHLESMMRTLVHRGPDGEGRYVDATRGVAIGHRRLAINDLGASGAQPLRDVEGRIHLAVNGEFYDFRRERALLMARGDRFVSRSDSEIAIGLYRRHGLSFVEHLRGEFAFTLFDAERDELLLVRDRFGVRPLFYHATPDQVVWGSELKAVLAHPQVPRRLCRRAALNQMMQVMVPGTTPFEGVYALKPGHILRVRRSEGGGFAYEDHCYWDLDFPSADQHDAPDDADYHADAIREALVEAIALRLDADVPVGCYLSGGIDSGAMLGLATGFLQRPITAFTIGFAERKYDESALAWMMAKRMGAKHELVSLAATDLYGESFRSAVRHAERTFHNTLGVAKWHLSRHVNACGFKTVITGKGDDELFGGYPHFKRDMLLHGMDDQTPRARRAAAEAVDSADGRTAHHPLVEDEQHHPSWESLCGYTPSWIQPWIAMLEEVRPLLSSGAQAELGDYDPVAAVADEIDESRVVGRHPLDRAQYTWAKTMLEGQILNWGGDRMDMAHSVESRPAFLDHHLAEIAVRVPPKFRITGSVEKWILRRAVKGVLPTALHEREKFAFLAPPAYASDAVASQAFAFAREVLSEERVARVGLFDTARVTSFVNTAMADTDRTSRIRSEKLLNHLLTIHLLHEELVERKPDSVREAM